MFSFDHAVILVSDLERAISDFRDQGFTVTPGGAHAAGVTRNALIAFRDGSYLELLAFTGTLGWAQPWLRRAGALGRAAARHEGMERRFLLHSAAGEGLIDFALLPTTLAEDLARARAAGLEAEGPLPGGRVRPDGETVEWEMGIPRTADLPFLCADVTPHDLRVPDGEAREHANGIVGVAGIVVAVSNLEASSARYRALLGMDPGMHPESATEGGRTRVFRLQGSEVVLASPSGGSGPLRRRLRSGDGPIALRLRFEGPRPELDLARLHGARLELAEPRRGGGGD